MAFVSPESLGFSRPFTNEELARIAQKENEKLAKASAEEKKRILEEYERKNR